MPRHATSSAPLSRSSTLLASSPAKSAYRPASDSDDELTERIRRDRKRIRKDLDALAELEDSRSNKRRARSKTLSVKSESP